MEEMKELKSRVYDLLAQRQAVEQEIQKVNQQIVELSQKPKEEPKPEEVKG